MRYIKRFVILFSLLVLALPALAIEDNLTIVGGDEQAMREFIQVYLRDMSPPETETTVYIGELPESLSVDLPSSDIARMIGSIVRKGPYPSTEVIYMSTNTVAGVQQVYEQELGTNGWERIDNNYGPRGFVAEEQAYADFCSAEGDQFLNVNIREIEDESQVRVNINENADPYMCNQGNTEDINDNDPYRRLPELETPEGVTLLINRGGGGGGGGYPGNVFSSTSTWLQSDVLSLDELMAVYNEQLVANGWQETSNESGEHMGLSLWSFAGTQSEWSGYFSLMESATTDGLYYATIMVEQIPE